MCHVYSFLFFSSNFFLPRRESQCVHHHAWGRTEGKTKRRERHGFRAWKILKIFLPSSLPPNDGKFFARYYASRGWWPSLGWRLLFHCYIFSSICIYLFFCTNISLRSMLVYIARAQWERRERNEKRKRAKFIIWKAFFAEYLESQWATAKGKGMSDRWHGYLK